MIKNAKIQTVYIQRGHNCNQIIEILVSVGKLFQSLIDLGYGKRDGEGGGSG